ncbi:MAG: polysaccharide deacetylase family protein, partial [Pseudomonadota bacterium]
PGSTEQLLAVLKEAGAHATFFLVGERAELSPVLVQSIVEAGHEIGNHTFQETPTVKLDDDDARESIERTHEILSAYAEIRWFRPGSARYDDAMLVVADELGYRIALADTFPYDTFITSTGFHAWYIRRSVRPGSIIVLHNAHGRGVRAAQTLGRVLPRLQEDGFRVVTLSELVDDPACTSPDEVARAAARNAS